MFCYHLLFVALYSVYVICVLSLASEENFCRVSVTDYNSEITQCSSLSSARTTLTEDDAVMVTSSVTRQPEAVLVTGGAGYIGSHTVVELLDAHQRVVVVDNLVNCKPGGVNMKPISLQRVEKITGKTLDFYRMDLRSRNELVKLFQSYNFSCVIHFAGLKSVASSVENPLEYYNNNVVGSITLFEVMQLFNVKRIIFSSSATVYGKPLYLPLTEEHPVGINITNPYGTTKYFIETILKSLYDSDNTWQISVLRYFNPVGAHPSGEIGEDPLGLPNNLVPYVSQVAAGVLSHVRVFGDNYRTEDGTGVRDYIHVVDLARGHIAALRHLDSSYRVYNLGTGRGYSVLDVISAYRNVSGQSIQYKIESPRPGDVDAMYSDCSLARRELNWSSQYSLHDMMLSAWNWQSQNIKGYLNI